MKWQKNMLSDNIPTVPPHQHPQNPHHGTVVGIWHVLLAAVDVKILPAHGQGKELCWELRSIEASHACCCGGWELILPERFYPAEIGENSGWNLSPLKA